MKILHLIDSLATGGAEKLILETIPLLKNKGIVVDLLVLDGNDYPYMQQLKALNCCAIFSLGKGSLYNPLYIFKIIPYLSKYDLIHVHLFPAQYWAVFAKIFSFSKTKLIFTEHNTSNRRMQNSLFKPIELFVYSFYTKIVCITNEVKEALELHTRFNSKKFEVISNGVNLEVIKFAERLEKKEIHQSLHSADALIMHVAGFRVQKDQKTVIRAMAHLENYVKLLFVGDGVLRQECEALVHELGLQERVLFLGVRTDVSRLLKSVEISVVSSHWEGFGLAAVEGMAVGKPVIASNVEGLCGVVNGAGILFEKGNEIELAEKIKALLSDEKYYEKVGRACLERAKEYDIIFMVDQHVELYKNLWLK